MIAVVMIITTSEKACPAMKVAKILEVPVEFAVEPM